MSKVKAGVEVLESLFDTVRHSFDEFDPRYDKRVGEQQRLQDRGVDVGNIDPSLLALLGLGTSSLFAAPLLVEELMEE